MTAPLVEREIQRIIPYHLATERTSIAGNATATIVIQVPGDADFDCRYITHVKTGIASMIIRDAGTRLEIMNRAIQIALIAGTGAQPYVIPAPFILTRNSNIELVIADLSTQTNIIQICFCGFLVYPKNVAGGV